MALVLDVLVHAGHADHTFISLTVEIELILVVTAEWDLPQESHQVLYVNFGLLYAIHREQLEVGEVQIVIDRLQAFDDQVRLSAPASHRLFGMHVLFRRLR
jgi:hypothetical protein